MSPTMDLVDVNQGIYLVVDLDHGIGQGGFLNGNDIYNLMNDLDPLLGGE